MWISRETAGKSRSALRRRALDAFGLAAVFGFLPELARARGVVLEPHPGWIAVLILAARDGSGGLFAGLIAGAAAIAAGSAIAGTGLATWSSLDSAPNLIAFGACLIVSWVASRHLRRDTDLGERLRAVSDRAAAAEATIGALRDVIATLRARVDRTSNSLSFVRDVAARMEGSDPVAAAEGAADLALARTGAYAAEVKVGSGAFQRLLAVRDAREPGVLTPLALRDADVKVPIRDGNHRVGVIALWGIPRPGLDDATAHDLEVIASWCVPALAVAAWRPAEPADSVRRVS
jgi:uncharacterized coiled-coil protein SlyX